MLVGRVPICRGIGWSVCWLLPVVDGGVPCAWLWENTRPMAHFTFEAATSHVNCKP